MKRGRVDLNAHIYKGDRVKVAAGGAMCGQSGIAMQDCPGRSGPVMVQFEGYPKPRKIEASRLLVVKPIEGVDRNKATKPAPPQPVGRSYTRGVGETDRQLRDRIQERLSKQDRKVRASREEKRRALIQARLRAGLVLGSLLARFPSQEDRDAEEAVIHERAAKLEALSKARKRSAYWQ